VGLNNSKGRIVFVL